MRQQEDMKETQSSTVYMDSDLREKYSSSRAGIFHMTALCVNSFQ